MEATEAIDTQPLADQVAELVKRYTYGRIRNLEVEETRGRVEVRGEVRTWHAKQLALQAALEMLPGDQLRERIIVIGAGTSAR